MPLPVAPPDGVADVGAGPPVLLVHGQPGVGRDWDLVIDAARADFRLVVPDRPGYGDGPDRARSMADNAAFLAGLLRDLRADPAVVVGHSYGGGIALLLAAAQPQLVRGLVLVGSVGARQWLGPLDRLLAWPGVGEGLATVGLAAIGGVLPFVRPAAGLLPGRTGRWLTAALPDKGHAWADVGRPGGRGRVQRSFLLEQRALLEEIDAVEAAMARVVTPTTVIAGEWDVVVPPALARRLAAGIAGAELVVVAGTGHFLPRDRPDVVVDGIRRVESAAGARPPAVH